jgi:hypothetical protein
MAALNIKKEDPLLWQLYMDLFEFHKAFGKPEKTDLYWEKLVQASGALAEKYSKTPLHELADRMLSAVVDYLDFVYRNEE